jgi:hypothetical protein
MYPPIYSSNLMIFAEHLLVNSWKLNMNSFKSKARSVILNCSIRDMDAERVVKRLKIDSNFWNMRKMFTIKTLLILA